jgi:hypothetical protein
MSMSESESESVDALATAMSLTALKSWWQLSPSPEASFTCSRMPFKYVNLS